jgi:hypothetical protein
LLQYINYAVFTDCSFFKRFIDSRFQNSPSQNCQDCKSMKRISSIIFCFLLLVSCGKERNASAIISTSPQGAEGSNSSENAVSSNTSEALEVQIPMSNEQLKEWIPEKIGEMEQRKLIIGHKQGMEMSGAIATYQDIGHSDKQVSMEVLDGAGATGAVMLKSISQKLILDYEEKMDTGYSKIYERDGVRVWERFNSLDHSADIEYVTRGRFHFIFKGHQIQMEELWAFVTEVKEAMN